MVENKSKDKAIKAITDFLNRTELHYEDTPHFHLSPNFGKKKSLIVRVWWKVVSAVINFFSDVFTAIKVIVKEVM